jgi:hypothetical protein
MVCGLFSSADTLAGALLEPPAPGALADEALEALPDADVLAAAAVDPLVAAGVLPEATLAPDAPLLEPPQALSPTAKTLSPTATLMGLNRIFVLVVDRFIGDSSVRCY